MTLLNYFEQYFFSSNTVISDSFGKKYICYIAIPFFQIFLNVTFISKHDDNAAGATEKIFHENEFCIIQDNDKSKVMILCF